MRGITVNNNLLALNAGRMYGLNRKSNAKSVEKLSSGYKINRAADDAAGLAISEKMRKLIRGLNQGTKNAQDGISWMQVGDGALEEAHDMLKRMNDLAVKSLNGTNSSSDRQALDSEFQQLKREMERISTTTKFNEIDIFSKHKQLWYQSKGAVRWKSDQIHIVEEGKNDLSFGFRVMEDGDVAHVSINVAPGEYTTLELLDEIDDALSEVMGESIRIFMDIDKEGYIDATLEGGISLDHVSGDLSYLMYDMYYGGMTGALIGTTEFTSETAELEITAGKNDNMSFEIVSFDKTVDPISVELTIPAGYYTRSALIEKLNEMLEDKLQDEEISLTAEPYQKGIKLGSEEAIVTGFKGNMFQIDGADYTSVFYDNISYSEVEKIASHVYGGYIFPLTPDSRDDEHKYIRIEAGKNDVLSFRNINNSTVSADFTLNPGQYRLADISDQLNQFFEDNNLELAASVKNTPRQIKVAEAGSSNNTYYSAKYTYLQRLEITSTYKGPGSDVGLDTGSSAYDTLFKDKGYNYYNWRAYVDNETYANKEGKCIGTKVLTTPVSLTANNNAFRVSFSEQSSTGTNTWSRGPIDITLPAASYASVDDLVSAINSQIENNNVSKGKIKAINESGKIGIVGVEGKNIVSISVNQKVGNKGYDELFVGRSNTVYTRNSYYSSIVLDDKVGDSSLLKITVGTTSAADASTYQVNLTNPGNTNQILADINNALQAKETEQLRKFADVSDAGSNGAGNHFSVGKNGKTNYTAQTGQAKGDSDGVEGVVTDEVRNSTPAVLTLGVQLRNSMVVDSSNDKVTVEVNGVRKTVELTHKTYNQQQLRTELNSKLAEAYGVAGNRWGGVSVGGNGNYLVLTGGLEKTDGKKADGKRSTIEYNTDDDSSFLKWLCTTESPAVCESSMRVASSVVINSTNNQFKFDYTNAKGETKTISLTLANSPTGGYSASGLVNQIQTQLNTHPDTQNLGIRASLSYGKLVLTSKECGDRVRIAYTADSSAGSAMNPIFALNMPSGADILINTDIQASIKVESGAQEFILKHNGSDLRVTMNIGTYNRNTFLSMIQGKLSGTGVEAYLAGNKLGFRTTGTGSTETLSMKYDNGGNGMKAVYGTAKVVTPGVKASLSGDKIMLSVVDKNGNTMGYPNYRYISVASNTSGGLLYRKEIPLTPESGYHSRDYSRLVGRALVNTSVNIDQWNDELNFTFRENSSSHNVSIQVDHGTYSYEQLQQELQAKVDDAMGAPDKIKVSVTASGVVFSAPKWGNQYNFSSGRGDFYDNVMCQCMEVASTETPEAILGEQKVHSYAIGRKDVKTKPVEIIKGISDELVMDLTFGGQVHTIKMLLAPGRYDGNALKKHLQEKMDEQLEKLGLNPGVVNVGIGNIISSVGGATNDDKALNFSLSNEILAPEGDFYIDGISGNAAFEIFYQTDGRMIPTHIMGTKDVSQGVTVNPDETGMTFSVDDNEEYSIEIEPGDYTADELIAEVNRKLKSVNAPLSANLDEETGRLKILHKKINGHRINWISGSARNDIFFEDVNGKDDLVHTIRLSDDRPDFIELKRSEFSNSMIGINSLCLSKVKYASKAVNRISDAIERVSALRSEFGSMQNRLEHSVNNNNNKAENLQSAESIIRDTDMAQEMVRQSVLSILEQAGITMMAQANQSHEIVLEMLA